MEVFGDLSTTATGLKGRVQNVANSLQSANNELELGKNHVEEMKFGNTSNSSALQAEMDDLKRYIRADLQRLDDDFKAQVSPGYFSLASAWIPDMNLQKNENVRLQQCLTTLKGEKTSIHQQVIAIQRRVDEIDEEIGNESHMSDKDLWEEGLKMGLNELNFLSVNLIGENAGLTDTSIISEL
ncbi:hypothetical protein FOL47_008043 [Perkinsus chesapeaki]|uniref:Uncharacterized protein n=1 Tax=Perkinsus chesapeaki TaxID=330153 RepID=A0A7J6N204_PERCH|nr:hypothetical protein FOL47_008043 [Perkinsus chesapeaki]